MPLKSVDRKVSVWFGHVQSKSEFNTLLKPEGDGSKFCKDFKIDWYDHDKQEASYFKKDVAVRDFFQAKNFSYAKSFLDSVEKAANGSVGNVLILLYDYEYTKKYIANNKLSFLGSFDYEKEMSPFVKAILEKRRREKEKQ